MTKSERTNYNAKNTDWKQEKTKR